MNSVVAQENRPVREDQAAQAQRRGWLQPNVDIVETKEGYHLEAEMPGVAKDGLEVLLEENELTIVGRRKPVSVGSAQLLYRESLDRDYRRVFVLDPTIDKARINARMENGLLLLDLPKAEQVKPRKITVS